VGQEIRGKDFTGRVAATGLPGPNKFGRRAVHGRQEGCKVEGRS